MTTSPFGLPPLHGMNVQISHYLCDLPTFLRWRRNHRKVRINKKWHKKYGYITKPCPGKCYEIRGIGLVMCPHFKEQLNAQTKTA